MKQTLTLCISLIAVATACVEQPDVSSTEQALQCTRADRYDCEDEGGVWNAETCTCGEAPRQRYQFEDLWTECRDGQCIDSRTPPNRTEPPVLPDYHNCTEEYPYQPTINRCGQCDPLKTDECEPDQYGPKHCRVNVFTEFSFCKAGFGYVQEGETCQFLGICKPGHMCTADPYSFTDQNLRCRKMCALNGDGPGCPTGTTCVGLDMLADWQMPAMGNLGACY